MEEAAHDEWGRSGAPSARRCHANSFGPFAKWGAACLGRICWGSEGIWIFKWGPYVGWLKKLIAGTLPAAGGGVGKGKIGF